MEELEGFSPLGTATRGRRLRRSSSVLLNSSALVVVVLVVALSIVFVVLPTLVSFISHVFRPQLVKKGWDWLNIALVLFAVVCGFLGRNYSGSVSSEDDPSTESWFECSDRMAYKRINRLRSSSSYPDLRRESPWMDQDGGWRYYDDADIGSYHTFGLNHQQHLYQRQLEEQDNGVEIRAKDVGVDGTAASTEESPSAPPQTPLTPLSLSSPPVPKVSERKTKTKRTYQAIEENGETEVRLKNDWEGKNSQPPPPSPPRLLEERKKRATSTKDFLTTLRRRRKKQRQRSTENLDALAKSQSSSRVAETFQEHRTPPPPPPPPSPLQPPSVLQSLLSTKKGKKNKVQSTPPPTASPPKPHKFPTLETKPKSAPEASRALTRSSLVEASANQGNESPWNSIPPPPPPPPPFKVRKWKFAVQGDFVRVNSMGSSRSSSPDLDEVDDSPGNGKSQGDESPLFCPSPDVDLKANRFIARFRAGLKLEKVNSMKVKQSRGKSNLGPSQIHSPETHPV